MIRAFLAYNVAYIGRVPRQLCNPAQDSAVLRAAGLSSYLLKEFYERDFNRARTSMPR
jgi:hypothetical protein